MPTARFACLLCLMLYGCGGSDPKDTNTHASDKRQLKDVPQNELVALCKDQQGRLEALVDHCASAGLEAPSKSECEMAHSACMNATTGPVGDTIDCNGTDVSVLKDCTATVADFEACLSDVSDYAHSLSCNDVGKLPSPPACFTSLSEKCPKLFK